MILSKFLSFLLFFLLINLFKSAIYFIDEKEQQTRPIFTKRSRFFFKNQLKNLNFSYRFWVKNKNYFGHFAVGPKYPSSKIFRQNIKISEIYLGS